MMRIERSSFEDVYPIWEKRLWANRKTPIREQSSMRFDGTNDLSIYENEVYFYKVIVDNSVAGVNSVFKTADGEMRSRGLYVYPEFRGKGAGVFLLREAIRFAREVNAESIWSLPRESALKTYLSAGFQEARKANESDVEFGPNIYVIKKIMNA